MALDKGRGHEAGVGGSRLLEAAELLLLRVYLLH